jgi:P-type E1-E2 ATPase
VEGVLAGGKVSIRSGRESGGGDSLGILGAEADRLERSGKSWSAIYRGDRVVGLLGFSDPVSPNVRLTVERLRARGIPVVLVTGDSEAAARTAAADAGISEVHARVSPVQKVEILRKLQAEGHCVAFVGDGVNDAPVLAAADLGIALGTGTEVAQEAGNVLLVRPDFSGVATALSVGRRTLSKVRQNLTWAIAYNAVLLPVAAGILVPWTGLGIFYVLPITGALAMGISSTLVVANSLSLRRSVTSDPSDREVRARPVPGTVPSA